MRRNDVKELVLQAYDELIDDFRSPYPGQQHPYYLKLVHHRRKFVACGVPFITPGGHEIFHWCRRPVCPTCANDWGRKLGQSLVRACPDAQKNEFRMVTLVLGITPDLDTAFDHFRDVRGTLRNATDHRRRTRSPDRAGWHQFAIAGAMEIDHFEGEDYRLLGTEKQEQLRGLGFRPGTVGRQWVVTFHGVVHLGGLGENTVKALFESVAPVVHMKELHPEQTLMKAAEEITGYAAKVTVETRLSHGGVRVWSLSAIKEYILSSARCSHGRQGFKLVIKPKKIKTKTNSETPIKRKHYIPAMPVLV